MIEREARNFGRRSIAIRLKKVSQSGVYLMKNYHQTPAFQTPEEKRNTELMILEVNRAESPSILEN